MSGMKKSQFGRNKGRATITFRDIFNATYGTEMVGGPAVLMQLQRGKMAIVGFSNQNKGPVAKTFYRDGLFTVPYEGTWNHFYFLFAYIWMNRISNNNNEWNSTQDIINGVGMRGVTLSVCDWFPPFTETFDDCWREGAMTADPVNRKALAKAILGIFNRFGDEKVLDRDMVLRNTAKLDSSPRTLVFMDALKNKRMLSDVMTTLLPYYATIYCTEYTGSLSVTSLTHVEPWPKDVCQPGRRNANKYVRSIFTTSTALQGGGTTLQRAAGSGSGSGNGGGGGSGRPTYRPSRGGGSSGGGGGSRSAPVSRQPTRAPSRGGGGGGSGNHTYEVGASVYVFVPVKNEWHPATITKHNKSKNTYNVYYPSSGSTYKGVQPSNIRTTPPPARMAPAPAVTVNEGYIPYIMGKARNSNGNKLDFKAMSTTMAPGGTQPYHTFQEGGAGNNFVTNRGKTSGGVIGALGGSPTKIVGCNHARIVILRGGREVNDEVKGGAVTFHPLFVNPDGTARVQLVSKPFSRKLGEPFDVDAIKQMGNYTGCAGVCINGKKTLGDGKRVSDLTWALQACAAH